MITWWVHLSMSHAALVLAVAFVLAALVVAHLEDRKWK